MNRIKGLFTIATIATIALVAVAAVAQDPAKGTDAGSTEMSPEQIAMMEKWQAAATPGEHHATIGKLAGKWTARVMYWPAPGAPAEESVGTATMTPILGGRFLQEMFEGTAMEQPFHGMGISGYDNVMQKHTGIWLDSMGTGIMHSEGTCESNCSIIKARAESSDPMSGERKVMNSITRIVSDKEIVLEMFETGPDGKEFKSMEIVYTR
jgi:hypothetical protein